MAVPPDELLAQVVYFYSESRRGLALRDKQRFMFHYSKVHKTGHQDGAPA